MSKNATVTPFGTERLPASVTREIEFARQQALVQVARIQAIQYCGEKAMFAVAGLTEIEDQLARTFPNAAPRLRAIGDLASAAIAAEVMGLSRRLG